MYTALDGANVGSRGQCKRESFFDPLGPIFCDEGLMSRFAFWETAMAVHKAKQGAWRQKAKPSQMRALRFVAGQPAKSRDSKTLDSMTGRCGTAKSKKRGT